MHTIRTRTGKMGLFAFKVDLEKVNDWLKWNFINDTLSLIGMPNDLCMIIMDFITSVRMQILWNGKRAQNFSLSKGINKMT